MGGILRVCEAVARKEHCCRRCGGAIEKGVRHAVVVRRFKLQLRTDRAHYPICRPLDSDGALVNGHLSRAVVAVIDATALAYIKGPLPPDEAPLWLRRYDWVEWYDYDLEPAWWEELDFRLDEYQCEFEQSEALQHVYGYNESDEE